jgi:hypothetical protein
VFAQDLCEAAAPTAPAVGETRIRKAKEEVYLFFRFQDSFRHLGRVWGCLCGLARRVSGGSVAIFSEAFSFAEEGSDFLVLIRIESLGS